MQGKVDGKSPGKVKFSTDWPKKKLPARQDPLGKSLLKASSDFFKNTSALWTGTDARAIQHAPNMG